ncbi:MAG: hypothetical protein A2W23_01195 [Planctomycetes bacterium RBG_16_43_13]|nr:MAG: hypothetical protein A2W23_01195 [Planctomycetes bacterium RBG_16_43_13]
MAYGKWGNIRGRVFLTQEVVASDWKGYPTYRNLTRTIYQTQRATQGNRRSYLSSASKKWSNEMTELQRAKWDAYAKMLKSAYNRMKEDVARGAGNIIRQRKKLESGFNSFVESNLAAIELGCQTTQQFALEAPFQDGFPPAPTDVGVSHLAGVVSVTWTPPDLAPFASYFCKKFRIWATIRSLKKIHPQIVGFVDVATAPPFTFNSIRAGGYRTGTPIDIGSFAMPGGRKVELVVQMDTIVKFDDPSAGPSHGATLGGDPSNVAVIVIP